MDDAGAMRRGEPVDYFRGVLERLLEGRLAARQPFRKGLAIQVLHHQEVDPALVADVKQWANMRVAQRRHGASLVVESSLRGGVIGQIRR
jgi:hypothetical protein